MPDKVCFSVLLRSANLRLRVTELPSWQNQKQLEGQVTDFFVHDNCFLREPVGVPNPVGDDRKE